MDENIFSPLEHPVIVRAWGDEPVMLFIYRIENNRCYVGSRDTVRPIGLPVEQVFAFDEERFAQLSTAFKCGDMRNLGESWANIPVDDFACNKYKINVSSSHDQENLTDSESAPHGDAE